MRTTNKLKKLFEGGREIKEVERWIFSLAPLGVAFVFFVVFLLPIEIQNKGLVYMTGMAAGFIGLQTYWIIRGWKRNEGMTIVLGAISIGMIIAIAWAYVHFI